jgi:hypothetical protein
MNLTPTQTLLRNLLVRRFSSKKIDETEHKRLLINCIATRGYISTQVAPEVISDEQQALNDFMASSSGSDSDGELDLVSFLQPELRQSLQSQQQSSFLRPGTFIEGQGRGVERLQALNQRGTSSREQELVKINAIFGEALKEYPDPEQLKRVALDIYAQIEGAYISGRIKKGTLKGSARRGFLFLAVHYALVNAGIYVSRIELISKFGGLIDLKDISGSEKRLKKAFNKPSDPLYRLINSSVQETSLYGMRSQLSEQQVFDINNALTRLKESRKIQAVPTVSQLGAIMQIYGKVPSGIVAKNLGIDTDTLSVAVGRITRA